MYARVLLKNQKAVWIVLVVLLISMVKPTYSTNVGWTTFTSTSSGTTITIYANKTQADIKIIIDITSGGSPTSTKLTYAIDFGTNTITVGASGGTYIIRSTSIHLKINGVESGKYMVYQMDPVQAAFEVIGPTNLLIVYFLVPLLLVLSLMVTLYVIWRRRP